MMNSITLKNKLLLATMLTLSMQAEAGPLNGSSDAINLAQIETRRPVAQESSSFSSTWADIAEEVMINALSLSGINYQFGGKTPEAGFDCSGFVQYVFKQAAQITLPPTARAISQVGMTVSRQDLRPGDLVFFNTVQSAFSHVGIYLGDNKFIHAPRTGAKIRVENLNNSYWNSHYDGAKRLNTEVAAN